MSKKTLLLLGAAAVGIYLWRRKRQSLSGLGFLIHPRFGRSVSFTNYGSPVPLSPVPQFRSLRSR